MKIFSVAFLISLISMTGGAAANSGEFDCVAQVPTEGILASEQLAKLTTIQGQHKFFETAKFRGDIEIALGVATGGCAHFAVELIYVFEDDAPIEDKSHYLSKAKSLLELTPFKQDALYWKSDFFKAFARNKDHVEALEDGFYVIEPGYSSVYLMTHREGENVKLTLVHDSAL